MPARPIIPVPRRASVPGSGVTIVSPMHEYPKTLREQDSLTKATPPLSGVNVAGERIPQASRALAYPAYILVSKSSRKQGRRTARDTNRTPLKAKLFDEGIVIRVPVTIVTSLPLELV